MSTKAKDYCVVTTSIAYKEIFERDVKDRLADGYELYGDLHIEANGRGGVWLVQGLIKL